ncbi:MAG TPA: LPS assembly protein LptD [Acidobacteriota bacterium]
MRLSAPPISSPTRRLAAAAGALAIAAGLSAPGPASAAPRPPQGQQPAARPQDPQQSAPFSIPGLDARIHYDSFEFAGGTIVLSGYVDIDGRPDWRLQADRVVLTAPADPSDPQADHRFEATGNVTLEAGEVVLNGTRMTGLLKTGTGVIENAVGTGPGGVYFRGATIEQREPGSYRIENGVVTPCTQALPIWEFTARSFDLYADDHVTMKVPVFKVKGVPLVVLPALYWPIDEDRRSTGLLLPAVGSSTRKGFMYRQPFFWAISRSTDATLTYDYYSKARSAVSTEFRHRLTAQSAGTAQFLWLQGSDPDAVDPTAEFGPVAGGWSIDGDHMHNLPRRWRLNADAAFFSSKEFVQGFEDDFDRFLRRNSSAGLFLTRSWSSYSLNIVGDHNQTFFGNTDSVVRRRLPEVEFRVRRKPIFESLYFQLEGSYAGLLREERAAEVEPRGGRYQRLDAFPEVSLQFTQIPWLTFSPFLAWRSTHYNERTVGGEFEDEPIFRNVYQTGVQVVGPSLFRIFDTPASNYSPRYKHVLEPRFTWGRLAELEHLGFSNSEIIQFDEIDRFGGDRHFARASLTNRFLAKRFNTPNDDQRSVWEVFSVELAHDFDLREREEDVLFPTIPLPWSLGARVTPTPVINFSGSIRFTPDFRPGGFTLTGSMTSPDGGAYVTWFRSARTTPNEEDPAKVDVTSTDRLTGSGRVNLLDRLVTVSGNLTWDVSERLLQAYAIGGTWNTQCCSIGGQLRRVNFSYREEFQFSVLLELLNVGQLGFGSDR